MFRIVTSKAKSTSESKLLLPVLQWNAMLCCAELLGHIQLFATLRTVALQAPLSVGILQARILEWVAMPSSRIFPTQGSNPDLWQCRWILNHLSHQGNPSMEQWS